MELPTGAVYITLRNGEEVFVTNADFEKEEEFANFIYNYLSDNSDKYESGIYQMKYVKDNETIFSDDFFKKD